MDNEKKVSEGKLLYDPMFANKPELDWTDSAKGGIFGKAAVKKTLFIIVLLIAIAGSLFFSFSSLSKDRYEFSPLDDGTYKLDAFHGQKTDTVLQIDFVRAEDGMPDETKPVSVIREYTVTGNDTLQFIFIGKNVAEIEPTAFYYCTALNAVYVDKENEHFADVDGILYKKENGELTEAVLCPQRYSRFALAVSTGVKVPETPEEALALSETFRDEEYVKKLDDMLKEESTTAGKTVELPETVVNIRQLCFAYCDKMTAITLPAGLKEIGAMAFFNCTCYADPVLPDGLEVIGQDAFSKCDAFTYLYIPASVKEIGHHAFWKCPNIEKIYMEASSLDGMKLGQNWKPQYRKTIMRNREVVFNAERGMK